MSKINIIDSMMGTGKTSWSIDKMKYDNENNYIYITPYLSEVQRIKQSVTNKRFYEPYNFGNGKLEQLHDLIIKNKNIASTHALFKMATEETRELLKANSYILILDEVMDVLEEVNLKKDDLRLLLDNDMIRIDKDNNNLVLWNESKLDIDTQYNKLKNMCLNRNVFMVNNVLLMWTFPIEVFNSFQEVYVLTYLFDGQIQRYYYDLYNIEYKYYSIHKENDKYILGDYIKQYDMKTIRDNINILADNKLNNIGNEDFSLSKSWYKKDKNKLLVEQLKNHINNYYRNKLKSKAKDNMWTVFKDYKNKIAGKGYTKGFVSLNCRATNDYCDKVNLVYTANIFLNPIIKQFFTDRNIKVQEDIYALSELIQWIWRARIRKGESINIYIPSLRMRILLHSWLNNKDAGHLKVLLKIK